jgi:hypothetical protein
VITRQRAAPGQVQSPSIGLHPKHQYQHQYAMYRLDCAEIVITSQQAMSGQVESPIIGVHHKH